MCQLNEQLARISPVEMTAPYAQRRCEPFMIPLTSLLPIRAHDLGDLFIGIRKVVVLVFKDAYWYIVRC